MSTAAATDKKNEKGITVWISGRIKSTHQVGTTKDNFPIIENVILAPAADPYSHPDRFCVMSRSKFGNENEDITIEAKIFCRSFRDKNQKTRYTHDLWAI